MYSYICTASFFIHQGGAYLDLTKAFTAMPSLTVVKKKGAE